MYNHFKSCEYVFFMVVRRFKLFCILCKNDKYAPWNFINPKLISYIILEFCKISANNDKVNSPCEEVNTASMSLKINYKSGHQVDTKFYLRPSSKATHIL